MSQPQKDIFFCNSGFVCRAVRMNYRAGCGWCFEPKRENDVSRQRRLLVSIELLIETSAVGNEGFRHASGSVSHQLTIMQNHLKSKRWARFVVAKAQNRAWSWINTKAVIKKLSLKEVSM